ncbi:MAG TPA: hypothetical protein VM581_02225 [Magnetospirillaceae bacterium]|nr:hypothetical protein [Magnetospirillaceae bacterium]
MSEIVTNLACEAIGLIPHDSEPRPLLEIYEDYLPEIIKMVQGDFALWLLVLNVVQQWHASGHWKFAEKGHLVTPGEPIGSELPVAIDQFAWRAYIPRFGKRWS